MDEKQSSSDRVQRRLRRAAGQLMEDSTLRSHLGDEQAQQLLNWGLAQVEQAAVRTANLPDDDAMPVLEEKVAAVRSVMQLVNRIVGTVEETAGEGDVVDDQMTRLLKNLHWLTGQPTTMAHMVHVGKFNRQRPQMDSDSAFHRLMDLIQVNPAATKEEEE
ncbi:MAG TPA: hypothetical protein VF177_01650 [Anaerolineae bacterium]